MERWAKVKAVYQAALEQEPSARAALVRDACGEDAPLRREVESLLAFDQAAESFLESPAFEMAARDVGASFTTLVGRVLSHYQVERLLGAGGMGEVYLAKDPRLERPVARMWERTRSASVSGSSSAGM